MHKVKYTHTHCSDHQMLKDWHTCGTHNLNDVTTRANNGTCLCLNFANVSSVTGDNFHWYVKILADDDNDGSRRRSRRRRRRGFDPRSHCTICDKVTDRTAWSQTQYEDDRSSSYQDRDTLSFIDTSSRNKQKFTRSATMYSQLLVEMPIVVS